MYYLFRGGIIIKCVKRIINRTLNMTVNHINIRILHASYTCRVTSRIFNLNIVNKKPTIIKNQKQYYVYPSPGYKRYRFRSPDSG